MADQIDNTRLDSDGPEKVPLSPVAEALAKQAAMRKSRDQIHRVAPIQVTPKVKAGRKNRRKIPK